MYNDLFSLIKNTVIVMSTASSIAMSDPIQKYHGISLHASNSPASEIKNNIHNNSVSICDESISHNALSEIYRIDLSC